MEFLTIALDAMGGDHGPSVTVPASLNVMRAHKDLKIVFVGQKEILEPMLQEKGSDVSHQWEIHHASEVVMMDESPAQALRTKKDSSMRVAINLVAQGYASACVSAGNTGALMATARFVLKTLPGIDRPAITTAFPGRRPNRETRILDLGANVDTTAEQLYQFAVMGSVLAEAVSNIERPTVGLLNVGAEDIKGNEQVKKTAELLSRSPVVNYLGYVEGDDIFDGTVDVVVCDGFVGNVMLKACEGISRLIAETAKQEFSRNIYTKLGALFISPILRRLVKRIDPRRRNGATLLGLNGTVIKSHGSADEVAFAIAVKEAIVEARMNIPQLIRKKLDVAFEESNA